MEARSLRLMLLYLHPLHIASGQWRAYAAKDARRRLRLSLPQPAAVEIMLMLGVDAAAHLCLAYLGSLVLFRVLGRWNVVE